MTRTTSKSRVRLIATVLTALLAFGAAPLPAATCCKLPTKSGMARLATVHRCCTVARASNPSAMSAVLVAPLLLRGESALDAVFVVPEGAAARRSYASRHFETGAVHAPPATVVLRI